MNKNIKKAASGLLLSALVVGGASAWLTTNKTAVNTNSITVGKTSIIFENQLNTVNLTDTFPMTAEYAAANLTPYTYTLHNDGDVDLDYVVVPTEISGDMKDWDLHLLNNAKTSNDINILKDSGSVHSDKVIERGVLKAGETVTYTMTPYIQSGASDNEWSKITSTNKSFKLQVLAEQDTDGLAPLVSKSYLQSFDGAEGITHKGNVIKVNSSIAPSTIPDDGNGGSTRTMVYLDRDTFIRVQESTPNPDGGYRWVDCFAECFTIENDGALANIKSVPVPMGGVEGPVPGGLSFDIVKPGTVKLIEKNSGETWTIIVE